MVGIVDVSKLSKNFSDYTKTHKSLQKIDFISELPPELSLLILSYCNPCEACRAALGSRELNFLANDPNYWGSQFFKFLSQIHPIESREMQAFCDGEMEVFSTSKTGVIAFCEILIEAYSEFENVFNEMRKQKMVLVPEGVELNSVPSGKREGFSRGLQVLARGLHENVKILVNGYHSSVAAGEDDLDPLEAHFIDMNPLIDIILATVNEEIDLQSECSIDQQTLQFYLNLAAYRGNVPLVNSMIDFVGEMVDTLPMLDKAIMCASDSNDHKNLRMFLSLVPKEMVSSETLQYLIYQSAERGELDLLNELLTFPQNEGIETEMIAPQPDFFFSKGTEVYKALLSFSRERNPLVFEIYLRLCIQKSFEQNSIKSYRVFLELFEQNAEELQLEVDNGQLFNHMIKFIRDDDLDFFQVATTFIKNLQVRLGYLRIIDLFGRVIKKEEKAFANLIMELPWFQDAVFGDIIASLGEVGYLPNPQLLLWIKNNLPNKGDPNLPKAILGSVVGLLVHQTSECQGNIENEEKALECLEILQSFPGVEKISRSDIENFWKTLEIRLEQMFVRNSRYYRTASRIDALSDENLSKRLALLKGFPHTEGWPYNLCSSITPYLAKDYPKTVDAMKPFINERL